MSQPDMSALMGQIQAMQSQMQAAQAEIAASTVEGTAGNKLVTVEMRGTGEVVGVHIDPQAVDPEDVETLEDLIVGALADANTKMRDLAAQKLGPLEAALGAMGGLGF